MLGEQYANTIIQYTKEVMEKEAGILVKISERIAASIRQDGLLHVFGCGHSHILVEEMFYRAGGLVPVNAILDSALMLHGGAIKSSQVERLEGYAKTILDNYEVQKGETIIIISNSGINAVPVEMAIEAKSKGLHVVAIVSSAYFNETPRHFSGKKLYELADDVIDNHLPYGDALIEIPAFNTKMASGSTVIGAIILHMLMASIAEKLAEHQVQPPVFVSGNIEGGLESNSKYLEKYKNRIKNL